MRKIKWEVVEDQIVEYAKDVMEVELSDWQLLSVMDSIEMQLEKLVSNTIDTVVNEED